MRTTLSTLLLAAALANPALAQDKKPDAKPAPRKEAMAAEAEAAWPKPPVEEREAVSHGSVTVRGANTGVVVACVASVVPSTARVTSNTSPATSRTVIFSVPIRTVSPTVTPVPSETVTPVSLLLALTVAVTVTPV